MARPRRPPAPEILLPPAVKQHHGAFSLEIPETQCPDDPPLRPPSWSSCFPSVTSELANPPCKACSSDVLPREPPFSSLNPSGPTQDLSFPLPGELPGPLPPSSARRPSTLVPPRPRPLTTDLLVPRPRHPSGGTPRAKRSSRPVLRISSCADFLSRRPSRSATPFPPATASRRS